MVVFLWLAVLAMLLGHASCIGQVQRAKNGRTFCPGSADNVLTVSPKKPLFDSCVLPNRDWHRVSLENLQSGHYYSIRLSYVALRTHVIDMKIETILSNGTSIIICKSNFQSKVVFKHPSPKDSGVLYDTSRLGRYSSPFLPAVNRVAPSSHGSSGSHGSMSNRELLDTYVNFLNPLHNVKDSEIEKIYLYLRVMPMGLPSGELYDEVGVYTETERQDSRGNTHLRKKGENSQPFFEFDILLAEKVVRSADVDIIPVLLVCITLFLLMNLYVLRRWHRYVTRAPSDNQNFEDI